MNNRYRRVRHRFFLRSVWRTRLVFWCGAMLVGLFAALFARVSDLADLQFKALVESSPYLPLLITPLGLLIIAYLMRNYFGGTEGSGVPQSLAVMSEQRLGRRFLTPWIVFGKILLCGIGLLCGATVGRVGPTIHIGAAIMVSIGKYMRYQQQYIMKGLVMAGGGAGIAAAFNLPLAGILFAIEEMGRSFDRRNVSMIILAIIMAGMVAILVHDSDYHFEVMTTMGSDYLLLATIVVVCGLTGGFVGGLFSRLLITISRRLTPVTRKHWVATALICGLLIALTGIVSGGVAFGSGYLETRAILACAGDVECVDHPGLMYPFYKLITTVATFISGIPAGLFVPVLATGAGIGSDLATLFPIELATTVILITMVAYYSGVMQTPITAFIVIMEVSGNNELVFALMATSLIASGCSKLVCRRSLFSELASNILKTCQKESGERVQRVDPTSV